MRRNRVSTAQAASSGIVPYIRADGRRQLTVRWLAPSLRTNRTKEATHMQANLSEALRAGCLERLGTYRDASYKLSERGKRETPAALVASFPKRKH